MVKRVLVGFGMLEEHFIVCLAELSEDGDPFMESGIVTRIEEDKGRFFINFSVPIGEGDD